MPKQKTHKSMRDRMKVTGTGKVMRRKAGSSHLMSAMSSKRRRKCRKDVGVPPALARKARILLGE